MIVRDYDDKYGIRRRVLLPDDDTNVEEGVPISMFWDAFFLERGFSLGFVKRFVDETWGRNLITPQECADQRNAELLRAAWLGAAKADVLDLQGLAREQLKEKPT